jgi:hypothetical protein
MRGRTDAGHDFLVMELLDGESLHHRLLRGPFNTRALLEVGLALADALDFGLAKLMEPPEATTRAADAPITGSGTAVGTVAYMSPE